MHRRAQGLLARREFSRRELAQRLARGMRRADAASAAAAEASAIRTSSAGEGQAVGLHQEEEHDAAAVSRERTALIDAVLDDLTSVGSLSDERFVSAFVDGRVQRGKGPLLIRAELRERGADEALIDRFLTFPNTFWIERVRAVRARRYGDVLPRDAGERQRQARFLASRGFAGDLIRRAFEVD